jgi:hypothetical protein
VGEAALAKDLERGAQDFIGARVRAPPPAGAPPGGAAGGTGHRSSRISN